MNAGGSAFKSASSKSIRSCSDNTCVFLQGFARKRKAYYVSSSVILKQTLLVRFEKVVFDLPNG